MHGPASMRADREGTAGVVATGVVATGDAAAAVLLNSVACATACAAVTVESPEVATGASPEPPCVATAPVDVAFALKLT